MLGLRDDQSDELTHLPTELKVVMAMRLYKTAEDKEFPSMSWCLIVHCDSDFESVAMRAVVKQILSGK